MQPRRNTVVTNSAFELLTEAGDGQINVDGANNNEQRARDAALREKIKVIGIGGGGCNAVDYIIRSGARGVEFLAVNTDVHSLERNLSLEKLIIGKKLTKGFGAGSRPDVGEMAAIESKEEIRACLKGYDMVYLAAGMGGGTGTGALPVIAEVAKEMGILIVSVVTLPFAFEGKRKRAFAEGGIEKLREFADALIIVQNEKLITLSERSTTIKDAFAMVDEVLRQAIQGVTDLVTKQGIINVDFADLKSVMRHAGPAIMGIGTAKGERRAEDALKRAMDSPLMDCSVKGAKGVLFNVTAGSDVSLFEVQEAAAILQAQIDPNAQFVWGWVQDDNMVDSVQMVVIATGFEKDLKVQQVQKNSNTVRRVRDRAEIPASQPMPAAAPAPTAAGESLITEDSVYDTPSYLRNRQRRR